MKPQELDMQSEVFDEFRIVLNGAIRTTVRKLIEKNMQTGTVSARIRIDMQRGVTEDGEIVLMPEISADVGSKIGDSEKMKIGDQKGLVLQQGENGELMIADNQISIEEIQDRGA